MRGSWVLFVLGVGVCLTACASGTEGSSAAGAATALGLGVATSATNRAITGDCWGRCSNGYVCNRQNGLCERGECAPPCPAGYECSIEPAGMRCVASGTVGAADPTGGAPPQKEESGADENLEKPDEARRRAGEAIFDELEELVAKWQESSAEVPARVETSGPVAMESQRTFVEYLGAVHQPIHEVFRNGFLERLGGLSHAHALSSVTLVVRLEIVIDASGSLDEVRVIKSSGSELFDVGALEAITRSAPLEAPPSDTLSSDGKFYVHWELHRDLDKACDVSFARPYQLK